MKLKEFIDDNRQELSDCIQRVVPNAPVNREGLVTKEECRLWILNDESLYNWARSCGVNI